MVLQLFLLNLSGVLDAISGRLINFFHINCVFFVRSYIFNFFRAFLLGMGGMNIEAVLDWTSGCPVSLLHKMGFAMYCLYCSRLYPIYSGKPAGTGTAPPFRAICSAPWLSPAEGFNSLTVLAFFPKYRLFFYFTDGLFPDKALVIH